VSIIASRQLDFFRLFAIIWISLPFSETLPCAIIISNRSLRQGPLGEFLIFCYDFVIIMMTMILWN